MLGGEERTRGDCGLFSGCSGQFCAGGGKDGRTKASGIPRDTGDRGGPLGCLGGARMDPRLRFQGSQPTAGKHSGLYLPLPSKWHYLNPASHLGSELAN